jgi:hypothetical protein
MSFLTKDDNTYINIKLTDTGRRKLAQGNLTFDQAVFSDREINYAFDRRYDAAWNLNPNTGTEIVLSGNSVFSPKDDHPQLAITNYDGSQAYPLNSSVHVNHEIMTAETGSVGFWSAVTQGTSDKIGSYYLKDNWTFSGANTTQTQTGGVDLSFDAANFVDETIPQAGQLMYMRGNVMVDTPNTFSAATQVRYNNYPMVSQWYRVVKPVTDTIRTLDRRPPFYAASIGQDTLLPYFVYEHKSIENNYGKFVTVNTPVWNLNIVRTSREIGHKRKAIGGNTGHSYTNYGSAAYAGAKEMFDFDENQRQVGFLHYSNESSGQTYWDSIVPGATEVDLPDLLWHRTTDPSGNLYLSGSALSSGHRFTDYGSDIIYDSKAGTSYTLLKDGVTGSPITVGRVYYNLKTIVLTDPELLTAMTYKANRNWTLPPMEFSTSSNPKLPFNSISKPGFMKSDHNYYMTYVMEPGQVDYTSATNPYSPIRNFGQYNFLHCGYIQKLSGHTDESGNHQHLRGKFPQGQLPFMRSNQTLEAFSGTGWGAHIVQILVQEVPKNRDGGADSLHPGKWSGCSDGNLAANIQDPAGVFAIGTETSRLIEPSQLYAAEFIVSQTDITTGSTQPYYTTGAENNIYELSDFFNGYVDEENNGMPFGGESHFFGNIKTVKKKVRYDTYVTLVVANTELNTSQNSSYDVEKDTSTFITEVGILNSEGELVAVGKPTDPIKKDSGDWKVLQLKLEF